MPLCPYTLDFLILQQLTPKSPLRVKEEEVFEVCKPTHQCFYKLLSILFIFSKIYELLPFLEMIEK